ncbi:hypothetical protein [Caballeronia sp. dw_19]|uniref:hypothetical protein n=1 Tax=Caballeronia sp. dw_19 TaxID=2719791 RepID=UPI001BD3DD38|nr:hypothetical protein [Caballeronia sp. dw_19]
MKFISIKILKQAIVEIAYTMALSSAFAATIFNATTTVQVSGKVQSVNTNTRTVTVINDAGIRESFQVGANVQGLDKLKAGTKVVGSANRSVRLTVLDSSPPVVPPSPNGDQTIARVAHVDNQNGFITLVDTTGASFIVQTNPPEASASVIPGTRVLVDLISAAPAAQ